MNHSTHPPISHRKAKPPPRNAWLMHYLYLLFSSLGLIVRTPLPSLMTAAVIGIALALPTGLYLLLENVQQVSSGWGGAAQISLFIKQEIDNKQVHALADQLYQHPDISSVQVITPTEALEEYRTLSGFGESLDALEHNPLPAVLVIQPITNEEITTQNLLNSLKQLREVEVAQFDMLWLKRLLAMMEIVRRGVLILAILLALAVLLVIGNTIRLAIYNRRDEIEIYKLVGATDAFIRRPFLFTGFWYGLFGGFIAWLFVNTSFWFLQGPVKQLTTLYYSQFELLTLNVLSSSMLLLSGASLGLAGAWLAVGRHLREIQPR
ncbi:permease-like cell division protein FtsX [Candidatus Parabeggiatoa sp. HSG14]|uniref:permease-like cell division protein FtsX n=1 Tax=Candidatus Parabeggiatoa sp. HSG14 TaxID=3055593 RepID=UPI0025A80983|nr:permease-like cell division protein FtsX [Thiotrichales bacterium HSG14]